MAMPSRPEEDPVKLFAELARRVRQFDYFVALRRIECQFRQYPRLGAAAHPREEPIRLGQLPSLAFAPAMLDDFEPGNGGPPRLFSAFFGLFGPHGALPNHITEYTRDRLRNAGDATLARFADLFHHRMHLLFYRAWATAQPSSAEDRPEDSRFRTYLGALTGYGLDSLKGRDVIDDTVKWYYAGLLCSANRSAEGLEALLRDYFDLPVQIQEFLGEWVDLPKDSRFQLGGPAETSSLGRTSVVGRRVWLCQHRFRVVVGPVERDQFARFLPEGEGLARLSALVRTYVGDEYFWDVRVIVAPHAAEQLQLGAGGRLGWSTRLGGGTGAARSEDLIVNPALNQTRRAIAFAPDATRE